LTLYRGRGCEECSNTGYHGRLAFYEVLVMTEEMRSLVDGAHVDRRSSASGRLPGA